MLQIDHLQFKTPADQRILLDIDSFSLASKETAIVLGNNGAGKSTWFRLIAGELSPVTGSLTWNGMSLASLPTFKRMRHLTWLTQNPEHVLCPSLSLEEHFQLLSTCTACDLHAEALFHSAIEAGWSLTPYWKLPARNLSGGEKQLFAFLLMMEKMRRIPTNQLLLLDEYTAALSPQTSAALLKLTAHFIKEAAITTLIISHDLQEALFFKARILILHRGKIVEDIPQAVASTLSLLELEERLIAHASLF